MHEDPKPISDVLESLTSLAIRRNSLRS